MIINHLLIFKTEIMKYEAKCTNCTYQVACIYDEKKHPIYWRVYEAYIQVDSQHEADLIELLDAAVCEAERIYSKLYNLNNN